MGYFWAGRAEQVRLCPHGTEPIKVDPAKIKPELQLGSSKFGDHNPAAVQVGSTAIIGVNSTNAKLAMWPPVVLCTL